MHVIPEIKVQIGKQLDLTFQEPASGSPYQEGGALYALGMIHANHGAAIIPYLSEQLQTATNEVSDVILNAYNLVL